MSVEPVAALYDIHGNLPALEAVLEEVASAGARAIIVGGDVVPGPMPARTLEALTAAPAPTRFLRGNGENDVLAAKRGEEIARVPEAFRHVVRWTVEALTGEQTAFLAGWPSTIGLVSRSFGDTLCCHATPESDVDLVTRRTSEARVATLFRSVAGGLVVCGHTHMAFDRRVGNVRIVNPGSVGMPFGEPGAHWLLIGEELDFRHTEYDLESAADRILATDYPQAEAFVRDHLFQPPSEETMLDVFDRAGIREGPAA